MSETRRTRSDLGKKRGPYNKKKELQQDFRKLRKQLEESRKKEPESGRPRYVRRAEAREASLPMDRTCPLCGCVKLLSRQWVLRGRRAVCLTCWRKHGQEGINTLLP